MNVVHRILVAGVVIGLGILSNGADAARATSGVTTAPYGHTVRGVVEHVNHHKHEIRVRIHGHDGHHHHEVTFHVNHATRFEIVHGKSQHPAHFRDVHHGEHVAIHQAGNHPHLATEVAILGHGYHKK
jgi:hypothetical protein